MNTILLIEDNAELLENTAELLELANYGVIRAKNGKEGLELARKHSPSLILCDIMMPELDGFGVLRAIENIPELKGTSFVFVTAKAGKQDFRYGMDLGADDYLTKPFSGEELLRIVAARLKKAQLFRESSKNALEELEDFVDDRTELKDISILKSMINRKKLNKKDTLFIEGESSNFLYYVSSGRIKTFKTNEMGKEYITQIYTPGDFFGYYTLLENGVHEESAEAIDRSEVGFISKLEFLEILRSNPGISAKFIKSLSSTISEIKENLIGLAYNSARKRAAEAILYIARKFPGISEVNLSFPMNRDDISSVSGISPESVSRNLTDFRNEGLIEIEGGMLTVLDLKKLENLKN